jgi:hypothetical protein
MSYGKFKNRRIGDLYVNNEYKILVSQGIYVSD